MNIITCQHKWVEHCRSRYRWDPPLGFHFENAHYPLSERMGGNNTVLLWYPDHIVQGCLQTLEHRYPCMDVRKRKTERRVVDEVYPEYLSVYDEAYTFCQRFAAPRGGAKARDLGLGIHNPEVRAYTGRINAKTKSKPVTLVGPEGQVIRHKSAREAARQSGINLEVITRSANSNGKVIVKGRSKGWAAIWTVGEVF